MLFRSVFTFSAAASFIISADTVLSAAGLNFTPQSRYSVVQKALTDPLAKATGAVVFVLSSDTSFLIPQTLILRNNDVEFIPAAGYTAIAKPAETPLAPNELRIGPGPTPTTFAVTVPVVARELPFVTIKPNTNFALSGSIANVIRTYAADFFTSELRIVYDANASRYSVTVPVVATTRTSVGNVATNTNFIADRFFPNLTGIYAASAFSGGTDDTDNPLTIDGQRVNPGMRILVKNQNDASENGIYVAATEIGRAHV